MRRQIAPLGLALALIACGDGSGPADQPFNGTWTGTYTNSIAPPATATLQITQDGQSVTGTLTGGRQATLTGTLSGSQLTADLTFTDPCGGTASTTATLRQEVEPDEIEGTYAATDCLGDTTGGYSLVRQ